MKNVLGLDLGVGSIGWCLVKKNDDGTPVSISKMGSRIVPLSSDEENEFTKGNAISKNMDRTQNRTARKCYDRYQLRRYALRNLLGSMGMLPDESLNTLSPLQLWQLRAKAATPEQRIELKEIGRILLHINQKRGYKHSRVQNVNAKETAYVKDVNARYKLLLEEGKTIGQHFAQEMANSENTTSTGKKHYTYRIKDQVYPRIAYEQETRQILSVQSHFYPEILTDSNQEDILNIIFFQRDLKSCKYLISKCEIEKRTIVKDGKEITVAPKVAPKTSPISQLSKILESANNITIKNRRNEELYITQEQRDEIAYFLDTHEVLKLQDLYRILRISKKDGWWAGKAIGRGLQGNTTKMQLLKAMETMPKSEVESLTRFEVQVVDVVDKGTGEVFQTIDKKITKEPLYILWHMIYSIKDKEELVSALQKHGITDNIAIEKLAALNFTNAGYSNKSVKATRRILPYLMQGYKYSEACEQAGFRHSDYLTREENANRPLKSQLPNLKKNELRQPVVEKVLNQMINIVNALLDSTKGGIDEIRVELARELKQSKDERNEADKRNRSNEKANSDIAKKLTELGFFPTRNRIQKYKMWEESEHCCIYCGQPVQLTEFLSGADYEIEHVIPKGLLFDNSFSNKVCSHRSCNQAKGMRTGYDYIHDDKSEKELNDYIDRVNDLCNRGKISRTKRERLLTSYNEYASRKAQGRETEDDKKIWENFIERQLRQSQYIATKAVEILKQICKNVNTTSGSVTDFVRHVWGYDEILHNLNLPRFRQAGLTEMVTTNNSGIEVTKERIQNWSKRIDNRHHAIDALTIACTSQSVIQRLNTLNAMRDMMMSEVQEAGVVWNEKRSLLEKWLSIQPHLSVAAVSEDVSKILISVKSGKKTTTPGKRYVRKNGKRILAQTGILVPRASLHDQYVYGGIKRYVKTKDGVSLERQIVMKYKLAIGAQGCLFTGNETYKEEIKKDKNTGLDTIIVKDKIKDVISKIVDKRIQVLILERLNRGFEAGKDYRSDVKKALANLKNLAEEPIYFDNNHTMPIRTVRKFTNSNTAVPIRYHDDGEPYAFVEPGNNHHVALYTKPDGKVVEHITTLWQVVERKRYGLPAIIKEPAAVWDYVNNTDVTIPEEVLVSLPDASSIFLESMQINDMFILGMENDEYENAIRDKDYKTLSENLYCVQNLSSGQYRFRRHTESKYDINDMNKADKRFYNIKSLDALFCLNPHKISIDIQGAIYQ